MKTTASTSNTAAKSGLLQLSGFVTLPGMARQQTTSIVLKATTDPKRQHTAIGKLVKMCKTSEVVTAASKGITAEVRRDRDRGHD